MRPRSVISVAGIVLISFGAAVTGCGRAASPRAQRRGRYERAGAGPLRIALVTSGPTSDNGWNAGAYRGLQLLKTRLGAEVENVEAPSPSDQEENLQAFAARGFDIVIGHGAEYEAPALKLEAAFPHTLFVISSGRKVGSNTTPIVLRLEDSAFLLGILAAGVTKTHTIAEIGAQSIVPLASVFGAFARGAHAFNPGVSVMPPVYTGSWDDVGRARQMTLALIDAGADVIIQDLDAAAQGVFEAVQQRNKPSHAVYALGTNSDQNGVAPDVILASAPIDIGAAFLRIATDVQKGTFTPNARPFGMRSGVIGYVMNPRLADRVPDSLKGRILSAEMAIRAGTLVAPTLGK